jgi:hypothetical protein
MAVTENVGYDLRTKVPRTLYKRNQVGDAVLDSNGYPVINSDVDEIIKDFERFKETEELGF